MKRFILLLLLLTASSLANAYTVGLTSPGKWGNPTLGTGATISYSFMPSGPICDGGQICSSLDSFMPTGFVSEIERAFDAWSSVANLTFFNVADDGANLGWPTTSGDIRFGGHAFDGSGGVLAHGFFPPNNGFSAAGDIHFDSTDVWSIGGLTGFDIFWVALHEIGHALGLGHEETETSVMGPFYNPLLNTLQADDIAGIQYLYGPPAAVPVPAAIWLFFPALLGLFGIRRKAIN